MKWHIALPQHGATGTNMPWIGAIPPGGTSTSWGSATGFVRSGPATLFPCFPPYPVSHIASTLIL